MATLIIRHKVKDYAAWKKVFAEHGKARAGQGFKKSRVYRYLDDPNHVIIVFELSDVKKAQAFVKSPELAAAMKNAGVVSEPLFFYLDDGEVFSN